MEQKTIKNLLLLVSSITKKYAEIDKITGQRFNIFKILDVTTQEVRMHSALLAELLDSKGSHGCGNLFMNCFLEQQKEKHKDSSVFFKKLSVFTAENYNTKVEHHIGIIKNDGTEGGRIDILITNNNNKQIIFENKINAGDQPQQLIRYNNYNKDAPIFYLTLNGTPPEKTSIESKKGIENTRLTEGADYICLSYKTDIIDWLNACIKEAAKLPLLRETIQQYIYIIKLLTNQATNQTMNEEIAKIISSDAEIFLSAHSVKDSLDSTYKILLDKFKKEVSEIANELNLEVQYDVNFNKKHTGFDFYHTDITRDNLRIRFAFGSERTQNLVVGVAWAKNDSALKELFSEEQIIKFKNITGLKLKHDWWPVFDFFHGMQNWNRDEYAKILKGDMKEIIKKKLNELLDAFREIAPERYQFKSIMNDPQK